jgi:diamine N-acetyltransferase
MTTLQFREISLKNLDEIIKLGVRHDQAGLVADNLYSIAQAGLDASAWCRGVYLDEEPVGFFLVREQQAGSLMYICRFMIDEHRQGQGLGRETMKKLLELLFSSLRTEIVELSVSRDDRGAEEFYKKCGFTPTNEPYRGGWRMTLSRADYHKSCL